MGECFTVARRSFLLGLISVGVLGRSAITSLSEESRSAFKGRIVTEWMDDGIHMKLVEPVAYIASDGRQWPVPKGTVVDGASIPHPLWSIIGGPFEGLYRGPSVIHDFYCSTRNRAYLDVHNVFYDAMISQGVGWKTAWLMHQGVLRFGPRWKNPKTDPKCEVTNDDFDFERCARNSVKPELQMPMAGRAQLLAFVADVQGNADPEDIAKLKKAIDQE